MTIDLSKRNINTYTIQRKNSDSTRNVKNTNTISTERVRHFTRKVEKLNKIDIEPEKKDVKEPIGHKTYKISMRIRNEGTFKDSIRNRYKRVKVENNS